MATTDSSAPPPPETKFVDKGLRGPAYCPEDPQAILLKSNHPYAPFTGNALTWESYVYDDGTTYEGLCREEVPHGLGVLTIGNGTGGALQRSQRGDKYEGEFYAGFVHGLGMLSGANGEVYRGEFHAGKKQGCGMVVNMGSFLNAVKKGEDPESAWDKMKEKIYSQAKFGTWRKDYFVAEPDSSGSGRFCHINEIKGTLQELEAVLTKARMFKHKPDGEVTIRFAQDAHGIPLPLMQDPLHYPFGTKFLAPGPAGQCFPVPDDEKLQKAMIRHAQNYERIHNMYNFDYDPPPGSDMWKAERYWKKQQEKRKQQAQLLYEKQQRRKKMQERRNRGDTKKADDGKNKPSSSEGGPSRVLSSVTMGMMRNAGFVANFLEQAALRARSIPRLARPAAALCSDESTLDDRGS
eukprot:evm.model.scf_942EXC.5 EVM.evm.TU.scf_942EXC.5   scf_942EXC:31247-37403(+)